METNNPYSSPQSNLFGGAESAGGDGVTQGVLLQLQKTKPWVRFFSVMMFIGSAFMVLAAVMMGALGATGALKQAGGGAAFNAGFGIGMAALYALTAVLYIYPALKLWKYADRIRDLMNSRQVIDLEKALNEQRAFWKFVGVMIIVIFALYFVAAIVLAAVGIGVAAKASGSL